MLATRLTISYPGSALFKVPSTSARNAIPVGKVRVCARTNATVELARAQEQEIASDKARFMPVMHSNHANKDKRSKAWRVTDDDFTTGVNIGFDEYFEYHYVWVYICDKH